MELKQAVAAMDAALLNAAWVGLWFNLVMHTLPERARETATLIGSTSYALPDLIDPSQVRELLQCAASDLAGARRDFEKTRWAAADTDLEFDAWLVQNGCADLCQP